MSDKIIKLEEIKKENPFKTPEGYFEHLQDSIMSQLPDKFERETNRPNLWERVHPWIYMAAMFLGISLMLKLFSTPSKPLELTSSSEIEEFYLYYEEQSTNTMYHETFYLDSSNTSVYSYNQ